MKRVSFLMLFAAVAAAPVHARDTVVTYTAPSEAVTSTDFTATVNGQSLVVYKDMSENITVSSTTRYFVNFSMAGTVTMNIKWTLPFTTARVLPLAENMTPTVSGKSATFTFTGPRNISFESNDPGYGYNQQIPALYIFANPLEVNIPSPTDPGVEYFAPGYHNIGAYSVTAAKKTVYLAGGAYCFGRFTISGVNDVLMMGRGIINTHYSSTVKDNANAAIYVTGSTTGFRLQGITVSHNDTWAVTTNLSGTRHTIDNYHIIGDGENDDGINGIWTYTTFNRIFSATHDDNFATWSNTMHVTYLNCVARPGCCRGFQTRETTSYMFYKGCKVIGNNPCNDFPSLFIEVDNANCFRYENVTIEAKNGWLEARGTSIYFKNVKVLSSTWGRNAGAQPVIFENLIRGSKTILQASDDANWTGPATFKATDATMPAVAITSPTRSDSCDVVTGPSFTVGFAIINWAMASGGKGFHYFINGVDKGIKYTADPIAVSGLPIGPNSLNIKLVDETGAYTGVQDAIVVTVTNNPAVVAKSPPPGKAVVHPTSQGYRLVGVDGRAFPSGTVRVTTTARAALRPGVYVTDSPDADKRRIAIVR